MKGKNHYSSKPKPWEGNQCGYKKPFTNEICGLRKEPECEYCIFHAPFNNKHAIIFKRRLDNYIRDAEDIGILDLRGFKFPAGCCDYFRKKEFDKIIKFTAAEFETDGDFQAAKFNERVVFNFVKFHDGVNFYRTEFKEAFFSNTEFGRPGVNQRQESNFFQAIFNGILILHFAEFCGFADFRNAEFKKGAVIEAVEFLTNASFKGANFGGDAIFITPVRSFKKEERAGRPEFNIVEIEDPAAFVDFRDVSFKPPANLIIKGYHNKTGKKSDLGNWLLANTEAVANASLIDVDWYGGQGNAKKRKRTRDADLIEPGHPEGTLTPENVSEVYRRLRLNYESRLAYEAASDFHIGQMEMLLKNPATAKPKKFFLWLYKWVSNFGESVLRPLLCLAGLWVFFTAIWLAVGFYYNGKPVRWELTWPSYMPDYIGMAKDIGRSLVYSFKTFVSLPSAKESIGRYTLGAVQRLAGASVITLFILALRRTFRR